MNQRYNPFGFLLNFCKITASQEILKTSLFVGEIEVVANLDDAGGGSGAGEVPAEPTGIVPVREGDYTPPYESYHTPPEGPLPSSSDEQGQPPEADDAGIPEIHDPFGSLVEFCQITSSQEEILETCLFVGETNAADADSGARGVLAESTATVMVSRPVSEKDGSFPHESHRTQPEDPLPGTSNEHRQPPEADVAGSSCHPGGVGTKVDDEGCTDTERTRGLDWDGDDLTLLSVVSTLVIDANGVIHGVVASEGLDNESEGFVVSLGEPNLASQNNILIEPASKRLKICDDNLNPSEPLIAGSGENEHQVNGDLPLKETEVEAVAFSEGNEMNKNDPNGDSAVKNVGSSCLGAAQTGRKLPSSITGQVNSAGRSEKELLRELLEAWVMVAPKVDGGAEDEESYDFLETAMRKGMNFPGPRWCPEEGFDN